MTAPASLSSTFTLQKAIEKAVRGKVYAAILREVNTGDGGVAGGEVKRLFTLAGCDERENLFGLMARAGQARNL